MKNAALIPNTAAAAKSKHVSLGRDGKQQLMPYTPHYALRFMDFVSLL